MNNISKEFNEIADTVKRIEVIGDTEGRLDLSDDTIALLMICKRLDKISEDLESISGSAEKLERIGEYISDTPVGTLLRHSGYISMNY